MFKLMVTALTFSVCISLQSIHAMSPEESFYIAAMKEQQRLEQEHDFQENIEYMPWPAEAYVGSDETPRKKPATRERIPTSAKKALFNIKNHENQVKKIEEANTPKQKTFKKNK